MALALGATPIKVWVTSPTFCVLTPGQEHLRESLGHLRLRATVAIEDLRMELTLAISGHLQLFNSTRGSDQVALVGTVAIPLALRTAFSPAYSNEGV